MIRESDPPSVEDAHTARADMRVLPRCPRGARLGAPSASRASSVTVAAMSGSESSTSELNPCAMWLWCRSCDARYCGRERYPASSTSGRVLERQTLSVFDRSRVGRGATGDVPSRARSPPARCPRSPRLHCIRGDPGEAGKTARPRPPGRTAPGPGFPNAVQRDLTRKNYYPRPPAERCTYDIDS